MPRGFSPWYGWLLPLGLVLSGCIRVPPVTIVNDRLEYGEYLAESWKRQTLLNLVRLRYGDTPIFLDVASVINSYSLGGALNAGAVLVPSSHKDANFPLGAQGSWSNTPTVSYIPVTGDRFARNLLRPMSPIMVFDLVQAGWPADLIFRLAVHSVNDVVNSEEDSSKNRAEFLRMTAALERVFRNKALGLRMENVKGVETAVLMIRTMEAKNIEADLRYLRETWNLDPGSNEVHITFGATPKSGKELAMVTRSMMEILMVLASEIDVPAADLAAKRALPGMPASASKAEPLMVVHSGKSAPKDAYAAVPYKGGWFWIEDGDVTTKCRFSFLMIMASLAADPGPQAGAPILTVPSR